MRKFRWRTSWNLNFPSEDRTTLYLLLHLTILGSLAFWTVYTHWRGTGNDASVTVTYILAVWKAQWFKLIAWQIAYMVVLYSTKELFHELSLRRVAYPSSERRLRVRRSRRLSDWFYWASISLFAYCLPFFVQRSQSLLGLTLLILLWVGYGLIYFASKNRFTLDRLGKFEFRAVSFNIAALAPLSVEVEDQLREFQLIRSVGGITDETGNYLDNSKTAFYIQLQEFLGVNDPRRIRLSFNTTSSIRIALDEIKVFCLHNYNKLPIFYFSDADYPAIERLIESNGDSAEKLAQEGQAPNVDGLRGILRDASSVARDHGQNPVRIELEKTIHRRRIDRLVDLGVFRGELARSIRHLLTLRSTEDSSESEFSACRLEKIDRHLAQVNDPPVNEDLDPQATAGYQVGPPPPPTGVGGDRTALIGEARELLDQVLPKWSGSVQRVMAVEPETVEERYCLRFVEIYALVRMMGGDNPRWIFHKTRLFEDIFRESCTAKQIAQKYCELILYGLVSERPVVLVCPHVHYQTGFVFDPCLIGEIWNAAWNNAVHRDDGVIVQFGSGERIELNQAEVRELGDTGWSSLLSKRVFLVVDGAQALGHIDFVQGGSFFDHVTFYAACTHKWLLGKETLGILVDGIRHGSHMQRSPSDGSMFSFDDEFYKGYGGTINVESFVGANVAIRDIGELGMERIAAHNRQLAEIFQTGVFSINGLSPRLELGSSIVLVRISRAIHARFLSEYETLRGSRVATINPPEGEESHYIYMRFCFHYFHSEKDVLELIDDLEAIMIYLRA